MMNKLNYLLHLVKRLFKSGLNLQSNLKAQLYIELVKWTVVKFLVKSLVLIGYMNLNKSDLPKVLVIL